MVPFIICFGCLQNTPTIRCCGHCGSLFRPVTSTRPRVAASYRGVFSRLNQLLERSHQLATVERHSAELNSLVEYCSAYLDIAAVPAHPVHIVAYLMHADSKGRTVVHEPAYPAARPDAVTHGNVCLASCPTRLKPQGQLGAGKTERPASRRRQAGSNGQWTGGHRPTENPVRPLETGGGGDVGTCMSSQPTRNSLLQESLAACVHDALTHS